MSDSHDHNPLPPRRSMTIKNLIPSLPERGKIKIGMKGQTTKGQGGNTFQRPMKLDHFLITTLNRTSDGNFEIDKEIHQKLGPKPTQIPIRLLYDDPALNFPTRYANYKGRILWCSGDGETAERNEGQSTLQISCPCHLSKPSYTGPQKCKMNGVLSVIIDGASGVGGVWKFRTTSYNSIIGLMSSMAFIKSNTNGALANIPFILRLVPKQIVTPDGLASTIYVVTLNFRGTMDQLKTLGDNRQGTQDILEIESRERKRLENFNPAIPQEPEELGDVLEEFYPEIIEQEPVEEKSQPRSIIPKSVPPFRI